MSDDNSRAYQTGNIGVYTAMLYYLNTSTFYFCVTGLSNTNKKSSSAKNVSKWTDSLSICKDPNFKEYNATDICEPNKHTTETGIWTNIFRVEISAHVDHGIIFCFNTRIHLFSRITNIE